MTSLNIANEIYSANPLAKKLLIAMLESDEQEIVTLLQKDLKNSNPHRSTHTLISECVLWNTDPTSVGTQLAIAHPNTEVYVTQTAFSMSVAELAGFLHVKQPIFELILALYNDAQTSERLVNRTVVKDAIKDASLAFFSSDLDRAERRLPFTVPSAPLEDRQKFIKQLDLNGSPTQNFSLLNRILSTPDLDDALFQYLSASSYFNTDKNRQATAVFGILYAAQDLDRMENFLIQCSPCLDFTALQQTFSHPKYAHLTPLNDAFLLWGLTSHRFRDGPLGFLDQSTYQGDQLITLKKKVVDAGLFEHLLNPLPFSSHRRAIHVAILHDRFYSASNIAKLGASLTDLVPSPQAECPVPFIAQLLFLEETEKFKSAYLSSKEAPNSMIQKHKDFTFQTKRFGPMTLLGAALIMGDELAARQLLYYGSKVQHIPFELTELIRETRPELAPLLGNRHHLRFKQMIHQAALSLSFKKKDLQGDLETHIKIPASSKALLQNPSHSPSVSSDTRSSPVNTDPFSFNALQTQLKHLALPSELLDIALKAMEQTKRIAPGTAHAVTGFDAQDLERLWTKNIPDFISQFEAIRPEQRLTLADGRDDTPAALFKKTFEKAYLLVNSMEKRFHASALARLEAEAAVVDMNLTRSLEALEERARAQEPEILPSPLTQAIPTEVASGAMILPLHKHKSPTGP